MKIADYQGYEVHIPESGGKAGKGHNATSTIQMRKNGMICKSFRFTVADKESRVQAMRKAKDWANAAIAAASNAIKVDMCTLCNSAGANHCHPNDVNMSRPMCGDCYCKAMGF